METIRRRFAARYVAYERTVATVLLAGMAVVIALAIWSFLVTTLATLGMAPGPIDYATFQVIFDRVLAALIALELTRTIRQLATGEHGAIQVKTVIVIGVLAVVRKLIILEVEHTSGVFLLGLAAAIIALGALFAVVHWIEERRGPDAVEPSLGDGAPDQSKR